MNPVTRGVGSAGLGGLGGENLPLHCRSESFQARLRLDPANSPAKFSPRNFIEPLLAQEELAWTPEDLAKFSSLARESSPEFFYFALGHFARSLEDKGRLPHAILLYTLLARNSADTDVQNRAEQRLALWQGQGKASDKFELWLREFSGQAVDPAAIGGMTLAVLSGKIAQGILQSRLLGSPLGKLLGPWGIRLASQSLSLAVEAPTFVLAERALSGAARNALRPALGREIFSAAWMLGSLKLAAWGSETLFNEVHGLKSGSAPALSGFSKFSQGLFTQAGMLGGLWLSQIAKPGFLKSDSQQDSLSLLDSLQTLLLFNVGGEFSRVLLGRSGARLLQEMKLRVEAQEAFEGKNFPPSAMFPFHALEPASSESSGEGLAAGIFPGIKMSIYGEGRPGEKSTLAGVGGAKINSAKNLTESWSSPGLTALRQELKNLNIDQRQLCRFSLDKILLHLQDQARLRAESAGVQEWLQEAENLYQRQNQALLSLRQELFEIQTREGLKPEDLQSVQLGEEADSTRNLRAREQLRQILDIATQPRSAALLAEIKRRLRWVLARPEFARDFDERSLLKVTSFEFSKETALHRYHQGLELMMIYHPHWTPADLKIYERAAQGYVHDRDIAFDVDKTLGDTFERGSAARMLVERPEAYELKSLQDAVFQFSRLRMPYRHMQATLLGLWAAGNRLKVFTAAENLPDNLEIFFNDFPLLKVAFGFAPASDPLQVVTRPDLHASPHFMDGLKRAEFYERHFGGEAGAQFLETIRREMNMRNLDHLKTTKMPYPDFPFQVLVDDLHYYPGEIEAIGLGRRWIESPGSGDKLLEKLTEYFNRPLPATHPLMQRWLGETPPKLKKNY